MEKFVFPCIIHNIKGQEKINVLLDKLSPMLTEFKLLSAILGVLKQNPCPIFWYITSDNTNFQVFLAVCFKTLVHIYNMQSHILEDDIL